MVYVYTRRVIYTSIHTYNFLCCRKSKQKENINKSKMEIAYLFYVSDFHWLSLNQMESTTCTQIDSISLSLETPVDMLEYLRKESFAFS